MAQRITQLYRQRRRHKLRQYLLVAQVRVDDVLQAVVVYETVEPIGGQHHRPRHKNADILPFVVQVVFLQHMVQERQSSTLSAHRAVTATREPYRVVVRLRRVLGHHAQRLIDAVVVD